MKTLIAVIALAAAIPAFAEDAANLNDAEIAHVAYTADNIDIRYAHLALALSDNPDVRNFAESMVRDHTAVNDQALALLDMLGVAPEDNFLSRSLMDGSETIIDELASLRGEEFDRRYAENELAYHQAVNAIVADAFIPNIENADVKTLFEAGLEVFLAHEAHAEALVATVNK